MACRACGDACKAINCTWARDACNFVGKGCTHFMERPLSTYVFISICLSAWQIYSCVGYMGVSSTSAAAGGAAPQAPGVKACHFGDDAFISFSMWNLLMLGFACINLLFAPYFQFQVWKTIMDNKEQFIDGDSAAPDPRGGQSVALAPGKWCVPRELVQESFKKTFMEDFGVLVYFFLLLGSFGLCMQGNTLMIAAKCDLDEQGWIPWTGELFFAVAAGYTFLWWCCTCCAKSIQIEKDMPGEAFAGQASFYDYEQPGNLQ